MTSEQMQTGREADPVKSPTSLQRLTPQRVIFNPGTESKDLATALDRANIPHLEACTLVLLQTGRF